MSGESPSILSATVGGLAVTNLDSPAPTLEVAPTIIGDHERHNTIASSRFPVACWRASDTYFVLDSSLILPDIKEDLKALKALIDLHSQNNGSHKPALTVFGHADPTGDDDYNKALSGRRAAAVYALLTRRVDIWEDLFKNGGRFGQAIAGDQWGTESLQLMLQTCGFPCGRADGIKDDATTAAVTQFQSANSLKPDGAPGPVTREKLFHAYMGGICVENSTKLSSDGIESLRKRAIPDAVLTRLSPLQDQVFATESEFSNRLAVILTSEEALRFEARILKQATGESPYVLATDQFLSAGRDPTGKADYQGCGEFNPVLVFSKQEAKDLADPASKARRDEANEPNRRVLIFLFRAGLRIDPSSWPCPRAKEGSEGCKERFFSDGDARRSPEDVRREVRNKDATFACRFYDRLSRRSPCELNLITFQIRLYDPAGLAIAGAPFEASIGKRRPTSGTASATPGEEGVVVIPNVEVPNLCLIKWGFPAEDETDTRDAQLIFSLQMFLIHDNLGESEEARQKLHNLGYDKDRPSVDNVSAFRRDYGHLVSPPLQLLHGKLSDDGGRTMKLLREIYQQCERDLQNTPPQSCQPISF